MPCRHSLLMTRLKSASSKQRSPLHFVLACFPECERQPASRFEAMNGFSRDSFRTELCEHRKKPPRVFDSGRHSQRVLRHEVEVRGLPGLQSKGPIQSELLTNPEIRSQLLTGPEIYSQLAFPPPRRCQFSFLVLAASDVWTVPSPWSPRRLSLPPPFSIPENAPVGRSILIRP
jgi:hypothetical protein